MESVQEFSQLTAEIQVQAGGKGGTLARLFQAGFPVPDGFVILPSAFDGDELLPEAWVQVMSLLENLRRRSPGELFAVRSSALAEDSSLASFAGEFETILGVGGNNEIREAIRTVHGSRMSERVAAYSQAKSIDPVHEIAIVVQQLVQADISGVLFTIDPVVGNREIMIGSLVLGLGDELVSGQTTGEEFTLNRSNGDYQGPTMLGKYVGELLELALSLERELDSPQDIEWAIKEDQLFVLQSRPITTLEERKPLVEDWNDSVSGEYLWSNVNFGEAVTEVMTPLSWTVLKMIFGEWVILPGYNTVGNISGRPYLNISLYASLFRGLGRSYQDLLDTLEGTLYMQLPEGMEIPVIPLSRAYLLSALPAIMGTRLKQWWGVRQLPVYLERNPDWFRAMRARIKDARSRTELNTLWLQEIHPHVISSLWNVMGSVMSSTTATMKLRRDLEQLVGADDANRLISNLSDESGLLASLGPVVGIARVARGEMERAHYLEQFGHRGSDEFELSHPRPAENPEWLDEQIVHFWEAPVDIEVLLAEQREEFDAAWERFQAQYPRKSGSMRSRINAAARLARLRESARSEYVRDRWLIRLFALEVGDITGLGEDIFFLTMDEVLEILAGNDASMSAIPRQKEIYEKYRTLPSFPSIILGRFDPFRWAADPHRRSDFYTSAVSQPGAQVGVEENNLITGSPGSAGRVVGLVRRLDQPEQGDQLQNGEILVTKQTDIAWTVLFPHAAAVITDVGAPLSHAAIVARELGIPAVVGCGDATMRLTTGDRVEVDGARGTVAILGKS